MFHIHKGDFLSRICPHKWNEVTRQKKFEKRQQKDPKISFRMNFYLQNLVLKSYQQAILSSLKAISILGLFQVTNKIF